MSIKLITYDLVNAKPADYQNFERLITSQFLDLVKAATTTWLVSTKLSIADIHAMLVMASPSSKSSFLVCEALNIYSEDPLVKKWLDSK